MSTVPKASKILTPAQYGAVAPPPDGFPINGYGGKLYAINRVYPTIQGEGSKAGTPMTIVRLQGCPVGCVFCDTPESWRPADPTSSDWLGAVRIADMVKGLGLQWALVTGGEPTWHDLTQLTYELERRDILCAIETAGVFPLTGGWDFVTLSPKPAGLIPFEESNLEFVDEIKWLVGKESDVDAFEAWIEKHRLYARCPSMPLLSLQPISASRKATDIAIEALMRHPSWRLSIQTHKMTEIA